MLADLSRRTGWTFSEIDEQDAALVLPALAAQNIRDILQRIDAYVETHGAARLTEADLKVYADILHLMTEDDHA